MSIFPLLVSLDTFGEIMIQGGTQTFSFASCNVFPISTVDVVIQGYIDMLLRNEYLNKRALILPSASPSTIERRSFPIRPEAE